MRCVAADVLGGTTDDLDATLAEMKQRRQHLPASDRRTADMTFSDGLHTGPLSTPQWSPHSAAGHTGPPARVPHYTPPAALTAVSITPGLVILNQSLGTVMNV